METDKKKPTFEPISAEEAKKIRAILDSIDPTSATECPSGEFAQIIACNGLLEGDECCWNSDIRGHCVRQHVSGDINDDRDYYYYLYYSK